MTLDHHAGALSVDRLGPPDLLDVFGYLDRDPVLNVYLLALTLRDGLGHPRDEFWAVRRDSEIVALLHLGAQSGAVLPVGEGPAALELLAEKAITRRRILPRRFQIIGPRDASTALIERFKSVEVAPRLERQQVYMSLVRGALAPSERLPELRRATPEDFDQVHDSGARLRAEELEEDPRTADAAGFAKRVEDECRDGYTHVWIEDGALSFRASVSAMTPDAAQVSGVYTPPERRNRGLARRALSELCMRLFDRSRTVCLFVNDFNAPALALYRRLGFKTLADWASAFYDVPR